MFRINTSSHHKTLHLQLIRHSYITAQYKYFLQCGQLPDITSLSGGWIIELLVWVPEMICTIWPNPQPGMETQYVGRWIVVSILGQLWANLRTLERLWQKSQR